VNFRLDEYVSLMQHKSDSQMSRLKHFSVVLKLHGLSHTTSAIGTEIILFIYLSICLSIYLSLSLSDVYSKTKILNFEATDLTSFVANRSSLINKKANEKTPNNTKIK